MRNQSNNPIFNNMKKDQRGYANFGSGAAGMANAVDQFGGPQTYAPAAPGRTITIDDVVTKTAATLGVLSVFGIGSYVAIGATATTENFQTSYPLAIPLLALGGLVGFALVMFMTFTRRSDNKALVLAYAAFEGLFVGSFSYVMANLQVSGVSAGALITQALLATFGVFFGMLFVYKSGAIRVTPRLTKMIVAGLFGVVALSLGNMLISIFTDSSLGIREAGPIGIAFSLLCIGLAAFSFLLDFDQADQLIRAQAPAKAAWSVALGLTVTLVWLYTEILRLLSMLQSD